MSGRRRAVLKTRIIFTFPTTGISCRFQTNQINVERNFRKTPVKGILKSRPVTPEVIVDNVNIVEKSRVVADKALNLLNPYRQVFSGIQDRSILDGFIILNTPTPDFYIWFDSTDLPGLVGAA